MKRLSLRLVLGLFVVVPVTALLAQQGGRGGFGPADAMALLQNKGVAEELKLTEDQHEKLKKAAEEIRSKHREALSEARKDKDREKSEKIRKEMATEFHKVADSTLKPDQMKRLHQIEVQVAGPRAFTLERVQKELKLTDKQKEDAKHQSEELTKETMEIFKDVGKDKDKFADAQKKIEAKRHEALEKCTSSLNADQKKTWKELTGPHFDYKPERQGKGKGKE
jgi:Spy/CpxP family protein refolding chaperone